MKKIQLFLFILANCLVFGGVSSSLAAPPDDLIITGVIDGPLTGGVPKAVELYVVNNIADLSIYGLGSANNGGGSDGEEFTFPAVAATAGDFIYVASESTEFTNFFGFAPNYTSGAMAINGDDAVELFTSGAVSDVFGDINVDGTGQAWEYLDGWAYRNDATGPDGTTFTIGNWSFSGPNALDGETSNATAATPFPIGTYAPTVVDTPPSVSSTTPADTATGVTLNSNITINFDETVDATAGAFAIECPVATPIAFSAIPTLPGSGGSFVLDPTSDLPANTTCTVTVTAANITDQDGTADNMAADYVFTFTTLNPATVCNDPDTLISVIQGSGAASPEDGNVHTIQGIVVGDFQGSANLSGFFVQEEDLDADANSATSEGLYVFDGASPSVDVSVGDEVQVTGTVDEFFNLTELTSVTNVAICSTGNTLPTAATVTLPVASLDDFEAVEGMLVTSSQTLVVTNHFPLGRGGILELSFGSRLFQPTQITTPGAAALAQQDANNLNRILLDDGNLNQNVDPIVYPLPGGLSASNTVRGGDTVSNITGVLTYSWNGWSGTDAYRIHPTQNPTFTAVNTRPTVAPNVGGSLRVASFNVLNYFTTFGSRGADDATELTRQRDKLVAALVKLDADIVGLMEIENHPADDALIDLVNSLNSVAGAGTYAFINSGVIGLDAIKVALIYKPAAVSPTGSFTILDSGVDPTFIDTKNRPVLIQSFTETATGEVVTVAVNHFKSKGSACDDVGDPNLNDGQGNCNGVRTAAALALANYLATDPTSSGSPNFLILGDLNSYAMEDPITTLEGVGYINLVKAFGGTYGYSFDGQWGTLDYAMSSTALRPLVTGAEEWHINADEPISLDYNTNFKSAGQVISLYNNDEYRASDHDPVVIGLDLDLTFDVVINEVDANQPGTDNAGFVELKNVSAGSVDLGSYTLELVNGSNDTVYETINLASANVPAGGYYLICFDNGAAMTNCDQVVAAGIQNGPDAVGLRLNGSLVDAVSYGGPVAGYTETAAAVGDSDTIGLGLSRFADGTDTNDNSADFSARCITPGLENIVQNSGCFTEFTEQCSVTTTSYSLGTTSPAIIEPTALGTPPISCLRVLYFDYGHPNATANFLTSFWHIEPSPANAGSTTPFAVNLTLPLTTPTPGEDKLCRWLDGAGPGAGWDCAADAYGPNSITRIGLNGFSDWAVGDNVGPTSVVMSEQRATGATAGTGIWLLLLAGLGLATLAVIGRRRRSW
ncbi:MAG: ExeM/NucH family extracellular endonuclease [Ardenticatenaceae bacterium]|nr:ExeM/NucH family extracellular endonuclease [Ardenticatenaceae bacterium]